MEIKKFNNAQASKAMKKWIENFPKLPIVDNSYAKIRFELQEIYKKTKKNKETTNKWQYYTDIYFGLSLYNYLDKIKEFNLRLAADDDFWKYMSIQVLPDIVGDRWGERNEEHYWSKGIRIWLKSIWWFIYLSWQGDNNSTLRLLESKNFNTDTILNLQERVGRQGAYVNAYRYIMYYYGKIPTKVLKEYSDKMSGKRETLFRAIMKLHTARIMVVEPTLVPGGQKSYALSLYRSLGVDIDEDTENN